MGVGKVCTCMCMHVLRLFMFQLSDVLRQLSDLLQVNLALFTRVQGLWGDGARFCVDRPAKAHCNWLVGERKRINTHTYVEYTTHESTQPTEYKLVHTFSNGVRRKTQIAGHVGQRDVGVCSRDQLQCPGPSSTCVPFQRW
jgi:hypothetical protein